MSGLLNMVKPHILVKPELLPELHDPFLLRPEVLLQDMGLANHILNIRRLLFPRCNVYLTKNAVELIPIKSLQLHSFENLSVF